jgi:muramoyltetrapeptide carboxypeptidase
VIRNSESVELSVGVFFSGSKIDQSLLAEGKKKIEEQVGQAVKVFDIEENETSYFAGDKKARTQSFMNAFADPDVEFLWAARGGYGTIDILDALPTDVALWHRKKVIGFSDITAMHAHLSNLGVSSYHAPMVATTQWLECNGEPLSSMKRSLNNGLPQPVSLASNKDCEGRLIGGNLAVLASLMGTPYQLRLDKGDVLFLEEINEPYYAMVRMLKQLSYSPNFYDCSLCWGELKNCGKGFESEESLVRTLCEPYSLETRMGLKSGHGDVNNCLKLGSQVRIIGNLLYGDEG